MILTEKMAYLGKEGECLLMEQPTRLYQQLVNMEGPEKHGPIEDCIITVCMISSELPEMMCPCR